MPDNFTFTIECGGFNDSLAVAFTAHQKAYGYYADKEVFILFWTEAPKATPFPAPLTKEEVAPLIKSWLENVADFGRAPDCDGDAERSWIFDTGPWGHIQEFGWQSFARIRPAWALYGK